MTRQWTGKNLDRIEQRSNESDEDGDDDVAYINSRGPANILSR